MNMKIVGLFAFVILLCGFKGSKEIGRIAINGLSNSGEIASKTVEISIKAGDKLTIWSDMDLHYEGEPRMLMNVLLYQGEDVKQSYSYDPREGNVRLREVNKTINDRVNWRFMVRNVIDKNLKPGKYQVKAFLRAYGAKTIKMDKADVVLKMK